MNKLTKAGIATAAAVALLMGGAGTLAYWNDSANLGGGTVTAGKLNIVEPTLTGTWATAAAPATTIAIGSYNASPGETLVYTTTATVQVVGNALSAKLVLGGGSIAAHDTADPADAALAAYLAGHVTITATGTGVTATATPGEYTVLPTASSITIKVSIEYPKDSAAGTENGTMEGQIDLSQLTVQLRQV